MLTILGSLGGGLLLGAGLAWLQHLNSGNQPVPQRPGAIRYEPEPADPAWTDETSSRTANVRIQRARAAPQGDDDEEPAVGTQPRRNWPAQGARSVPSSLAASPAGGSRFTARMRAGAGTAERLAKVAPATAPPMLAAARTDRFALPSPGSFARITFTDHLAAVESGRPTAQAGYRTAIDQLLTLLAESATPGTPLMTLVAGTDVGVGASSTALSLAYRAANTGTRTLLVDGCSTDAHLSHRLARSLVQNQPCALDNEEHLAEITMTDSRTGLALLPLAFTDLARFDAGQQAGLISGLRKLAERYELVLIDAGAASTNRGAIFLGALAERMLIVTHVSVTDPLLTAANFGVNQSLASVVTTPEPSGPQF
jgi:Mrp family chromosome partitioning ATPase